MKSLSSASLVNENTSSRKFKKQLSSLSRYSLISIMSIYILAACAPVCEVLPDTSFVAQVLAVDLEPETANAQKIIVKYNQYRLSVNVDNQVPLFDGLGNDFRITDLSKGQKLSILGILTRPNVVQAQEIRLIKQLPSN